MATLGERVAKLEERLDEMAATQYEQHIDVAKLPEAMVVNFRILTRGVNARLGKMDARIDGIDKRLDGVDRRLDALDAKFEAKFEILTDDVGAILRLLGGKPKPREA
jgi:hypothetical protein